MRSDSDPSLEKPLGGQRVRRPPHESADHVAGSLEHGRLLTYHGSGHTTYGKDVCADTYIDTYLLDLSLPPIGAECAG